MRGRQGLLHGGGVSKHKNPTPPVVDWSRPVGDLTEDQLIDALVKKVHDRAAAHSRGEFNAMPSLAIMFSKTEGLEGKPEEAPRFIAVGNPFYLGAMVSKLSLDTSMKHEDFAMGFIPTAVLRMESVARHWQKEHGREA